MRGIINKPSPVGLFLLGFFLSRRDEYGFFGDIEETYYIISKRNGRLKSDMWFWKQLFVLVPIIFIDSFYWSFIMLKNYLLVTCRNIKKQKMYSFINISGLAIGIACCISIFLLVQNELSVDSFHEKKDRIFRVYTESIYTNNTVNMAPVMLPFAPAAKSEFPEIEEAVRMSRHNRLMGTGDKFFYEEIQYADAGFFNILTFPLLKGNPETALKEPYSLVLTEEIAQKYFGTEDPVGKILTVQDSDYKITGILKKLPLKTHLRFEILASLSTLEKTGLSRLTDWTRFSNDYTYLLLKENVYASNLEAKFPSFLKNHAGEDDASKHIMHLQPLKDIYYSSLTYDSARTGSIIYMFVFSAIAAIILVIACINFINLSTARSAGRAKEVGLRKVVGAHRIQLIRQFISESMIMSIAAMILAVLIVIVVIPIINDFTRNDISQNIFENIPAMLALTAITLLTGFIAGSYPAFYLSAFKPARVLKGTVNQNTRGFSFRKILVVLQFAISVFLIVMTITVYNQLDFMRKKDLGFDKEHIAVIPVSNSNIQKNSELFKNILKQNSSIVNVTVSNGTPGSGYSFTSNFVPEGAVGDEGIKMNKIFGDHDFSSTYGLQLLKGRNFSPEFMSDKTGAYIINETAAKKIGWDNPIGKRIRMGDGEEREIVGVVKDFHYYSLRWDYEPAVFALGNDEINFISVKLRPENVKETLAFVEAEFKRLAPRFPFRHFFVDEKFERYYRYEESVGKILIVSALLAVFISCLGIFGLASFTAEQRRKEIGIRKTLGASVTGIISLITKQFIKWVILANIIACPLAFYAVSKWLTSFAFKMEIGAGMFLQSAVIALVIAVLAVSFQAVKAAVANPVDAIKQE